MNCCDYDCNQSKNCPARTKPTRRVRANQPPPPMPIDVAEPDEEPCAECRADLKAVAFSAGVICFAIGIVVGSFIGGI
jgi:hypothetical protein